MALEILTPTQFIHQAALKTPRVDVAMGKVVEYADVDLIDVLDDRCWLCGGITGGQGQPTKKAIKDTFTNHDMARTPASKSICSGCAFSLGRRELRNYSVLATAQGLRHPTRPEIRELLLDPPDPPFLLCIAVSGQKHLTFRARAAYSRDSFPVQMEETPVLVDRAKLAEQLELIEQLYTIFTKEEIKTGRYGQNRIREFGLMKFQAIETKIATFRGQRLFELAGFVAQKREPAQEPEKEIVCTIISTPMTEPQQLQLF